MFQEKRCLTLDDEFVTIIKEQQQLLFDGRQAMIFDKKQSKIWFYQEDGTCKEVSLPKDRSWLQAEVAFGILRVNDDHGKWLAYRISDAQYLGEYLYIIDERITQGNETWGKTEDGKRVSLRTIHW